MFQKRSTKGKYVSYENVARKATFGFSIQSVGCARVKEIERKEVADVKVVEKVEVEVVVEEKEEDKGVARSSGCAIFEDGKHTAVCYDVIARASVPRVPSATWMVDGERHRRVGSTFAIRSIRIKRWTQILLHIVDRYFTRKRTCTSTHIDHYVIKVYR